MAENIKLNKNSSDNSQGWLNHLIHKKDVLLIFCLAVILCYFLPYIFLGKNFPLTIHDNLDSNVVWAKLVLENGHYFKLDGVEIDNIMNGLPQSSICGSIDISFVFLKLFGFYWGYVANKIIMAFVAFFGMYFLLKNHFIRGEKDRLIQFGVALIFAILPFWSFTLSVAGLPLLLNVFLNLRNGHVKGIYWVIILLMSFYSSLIFSGFFFLIVVTVVFVYDTIKVKMINKPFLLAIVLLSAGYILSHISLAYSFFNKSGGVTHRVEITKVPTALMESFNRAKTIFINGHYHAHSIHLFIIPAVIICLFLVWKSGKMYKKFLLIFLFIVLTSLFYGFLNLDVLSPFFNKVSSVFPVQLQRFHTLHPMFWCVLFGVSLSVMAEKLKFGKYIACTLFLIQFVYVILHHEVIVNRAQPTYSAFYAEEQFTEIKKLIGKDLSSFRVISVGMHPAVALYNGFYTLDGYCANYPLQYKHEFRKVIASELEKNYEIRSYFDNWGSRCYAFSAELGKNYMFGKKSDKKLNLLDYDTKQFKKMGGEYIISALEIDTIANKQYVLRGIFENKTSYWKIYLYGIV
ncbi:MAG: hypothetical protein K0S26_1703 [Bacteroidota bacterium]|jgi:hypothetical protein|nr:hypothetical protein [Bacteroidota bacterium]